MTTITQLPSIVQELFSTRANQIAKETGFIKRQRKLTGAQFVQATVFGWLHHPTATRQQLHQSLLLTGQAMSVQGLDQRFNDQAVEFLRRMVAEAVGQVFEASVLQPLLGRFAGIYLTDSTRLETAAYPVKVAARLELQRGALQLSLEDLDTHDNVSGVCNNPLPAGALHIGDLGFFDLTRFSAWTEAGVDWISRYKVGTVLAHPDGRELVLERVLTGRRAALVCPVLVGRKARIAMYLSAQRVSPKLYRQRLTRLRQHASRKQQHLSDRQILLAGWTLYLTSVADLTSQQIHSLYRARWQIECLFKRWKSLAHLDRCLTTDPHRQACELLAKLLAVLLAHWLTQAHAWHDAHLSRHLVFSTLQHFAPLIQVALFSQPLLARLLDTLLAQSLSASRLSQRKKHPNAVQLWEAFDALA